MMRNAIIAGSAAILSTLIFSASTARPQTVTDGKTTRIEGNVEIDKIVHDFGDVMLSDGPLKCAYTVKNISGEPMAIYNVVTSCGCTNVSWTREPIMQGKTGKISVTYKNDEGPYPFEKTLTVYFSNVKKPVILRLRGSSHSKKLPLAELYPIHFGNLGVKSTEFKGGNLTPGNQRGDVIDIANIGNSPIKISLSSITPGLKAEVSPNPIPPNSTAKINYVITAEKGKWGKNWYSITPLVNGKIHNATSDGKTVSTLNIWTFTKDDFSNWSEADKKNAAQPIFEKSTESFNIVKKGTILNASFKFKNKGKSPFQIYKADTDNEAAVAGDVPVVLSGKSGTVNVKVDTGKLPKGDMLILVTLTTNTPVRPFINLFISAYIN